MCARESERERERTAAARYYFARGQYIEKKIRCRVVYAGLSILTKGWEGVESITFSLFSFILQPSGSNISNFNILPFPVGIILARF